MGAPNRASRTPPTSSPPTGPDRRGSWSRQTTSTPQGYWTTDDYSALLGLAAYDYLANQVGDASEATWATQEYDSLLAATNQTLAATISRYGLTTCPARSSRPTPPTGAPTPRTPTGRHRSARWAWDGYLLGATLSGPGFSMIDATYAYGFGRLEGILPPNTFGGFPDDYYSSGYNAGYGSTALAGTAYRDQGILSYEFMIENSQSGPYSWWESSTAPSATTPWVGNHPAAGQGLSPHAWGLSQANKVLLDSLVAQRSDGTLIVGRGVPALWLGAGLVDLGHQLPVDRRQEAGHPDLVEWEVGVIGAERSVAVGAGAVPAPVVRQ